MLPDLPTKKPPASSIRPFPWRCHECGKNEVRPARIDYETTMKQHGNLYTFVVHDLEIPVCGACGAKTFTEKVDRQIRLAFRRHFHLLLPSEIKEAIQRIGVPASEIAQHLGVAEETLSRWVEDFEIQTEAMDKLLRIYFGFPLVRIALSDEKTLATLGLTDSTFSPISPIVAELTRAFGARQ